MANKMCAVVIPIYRWPMSKSEAHSFHWIVKNLNTRDIFLIGPKCILDLAVDEYSKKKISKITFPDKYFKSISGYNSLLKSSNFYASFFSYDYILIAQLDALVFTDKLDYWCSLDYSYIGAPWFDGMGQPKPGYKLIGVGNGGLSLRRVKDFLDVLSGYKYLPYLMQSDFEPRNLVEFLKRRIKFFINRYIMAHNIYPFINRCSEDVFWSFIVPSCCSHYKTPEPELALSFSFEVAPERMYEMTQGKLPFGCHAWERYNKNFWIDVLPDDFFCQEVDELMKN